MHVIRALKTADYLIDSFILVTFLKCIKKNIVYFLFVYFANCGHVPFFKLQRCQYFLRNRFVIQNLFSFLEMRLIYPLK